MFMIAHGKKYLLACILGIVKLGAVGMLVENPSQDAASASMLSRMATQINQAADMIKKYQDMLEKAQATINQLNQVNKVLSGTQDFLNGSILNIANPKDLIDNAINIAKQIKTNTQNLAEQVKDYNIANALKVRTIASKCPEIDYEHLSPSAKRLLFSQKGKESEALKALKNLSDAMGNTMIENGGYVFGQMSGKTLAQYICIKRDNRALAIDIQKEDMRARLALLNNDYKGYKEAIRKKQEAQDKLFYSTQKEIERLSFPLLRRVEKQLSTLGVKDLKYKGKYCIQQTSSDGREFCEPMDFEINRLNADFLKLQGDLSEQLKAAPDKKTQAQIYANMKQKFDTLGLEFIKDIANNLNFMNSTLSAVSEIILSVYKKDNDLEPITLTKTEQKEFQNLQSSINMAHKANLTKYGFPVSGSSSKALPSNRSWLDKKNFDMNYDLDGD
ncbi:hypothetical protein [Helicobacter suis]|nr:hypothetical protein [Helicobacter suis]